MAHEVESMFSVKVTPWHGLGKVIGEAPSTADAIRLAGLDWGVRLEELFTADGKSAPARATVRTTDNKVLAVVGDTYVPLQNQKAFEFFDPFVASGNAILETAGSLREGCRIWVLARLNRAPIEVVKGDTVLKYLLLSNGHDGTMAVRIGFTPVRVVCANTLAAAHSHGESKLIRVIHSKQVAQNVEAIREIINAADAAFEASAEQYRFLASRNICQGDLDKFVRVVFDMKTAETERQAASQKTLIDRIAQLFEKGYGNELKGVIGTYWGLYNGVNQYLNYEYGRNQKVLSAGNARRLDGLWFGNLAQMNKKALDTAMEMAKAA